MKKYSPLFACISNNMVWTEDEFRVLIAYFLSWRPLLQRFDAQIEKIVEKMWHFSLYTKIALLSLWVLLKSSMYWENSGQSVQITNRCSWVFSSQATKKREKNNIVKDKNKFFILFSKTNFFKRKNSYIDSAIS